MTQRIEASASQPARLLLVEDESEIQCLLQDLCAMSGYDSLVVSSGAEALEAVEHGSIDLVILDVMLPDMNGYEVCQQVRRSTLSQVPILMLTALGQPPHVTRGLQAGADDYVTKPFDPAELLLRINGLLRRRQAAQGAELDAAALREALDLMQRQLAASQAAVQTEVTLRQEFLHNVTTHMQALYGIVDAALRKLPPSAERDAVQQIKSRVRGAALVYELSEALQFDPVDIGSLIRTIASALKSMYRPWKRVTLTVNGDVLELPGLLAAPIAMIVNELVTNCFKHAFPDNRFGTISLTYSLDDDMFVLDVSDNGGGFDPAQLSSGRGRPTIVQLVQGLQGTAQWTSSGAGTQVHISLPAPVSALQYSDAEAPAASSPALRAINV